MVEKRKRPLPDRKTCLKMLHSYGTPDHVIRHCVAVSDAAGALADALNEHGYTLDTELIRFSACMHDIARVEKKHALVAAEYLKRLGYPDAAALVEPHMIYSPQNPEEITEIDILCMADRIVKEDRYIGLEKRMDSILKRYQDDAAAYEDISRRIQITKLQRTYMEKMIGQSFDTIFSQGKKQN